MIISEAPKMHLRYKEKPDGQLFLQYAVLTKNTETGESYYAWENVPVVTLENQHG